VKGLSFLDKEKVRMGTLLATRTADALKIHLELLIPFIFETPDRVHPEAPNMLDLDCFLEILAHPGVSVLRRHQCPFGARTSKPTLWVFFMIPDKNGIFSMNNAICRHPSIAWVVPWSGKQFFRPHPPLRGRVWPIPLKDWRPSMRGPPPPRHLDYITRQAANYPAGLNEALAKLLVESIEDATTFLPSASVACIRPKACAKPMVWSFVNNKIVPAAPSYRPQKQALLTPTLASPNASSPNLEVIPDIRPTDPRDRECKAHHSNITLKTQPNNDHHRQLAKTRGSGPTITKMRRHHHTQ